MNTLYILAYLCIGILIEIFILILARTIKRECYDKNCITIGYAIGCGIEMLIITNFVLFVLKALVVFVL